MTEKQIISGCIDGDRAIQKKLYDMYSGQMYSICLRYCKNPAAAADALQNGFIKVFQKIQDYRGEGSLAGWIRRVVINCALNEIRVHKRTFTEEITPFIGLELSEEMDIQFEQFDYDRIISYLDRLPEGYRMVFSMVVLDELSHKEISEALNITEATSRSQLLRARNQLQALIRKDHYLSSRYLENNKIHTA